jgi:predicted DNA-binding transcriptional regulator YafY
VCITPELISKILAMGDKVEVLEPESLRGTIREKLQSAFNKYQNLLTTT